MLSQKIIAGAGLIAAAGALTCFAQKPPTFWEKVLRFMGITEAPSFSRGDGDEVAAGEIRVVTVADGNVQPLATDRLYRSPIFDRGDQSVLALSGDDLFRIPLSGSTPISKLRSLPGLHKLVGFEGPSGYEILALTCSQRVGLLSLKSFRFERILYGEENTVDLRMLRHIREWDRYYDKEIALKVTEIPPTQVFLERRDVEKPDQIRLSKNLSNCDRMNCGQPSMSHDRRRVVFIAEPWK